MRPKSGVSRRQFLRTAAGGAGAVGLAGVGAAAEEEEDGDKRTTVELVDFAFEPGTENSLEIPPGTTVKFEWVTDSHNIVVENQPADSDWEGHEDIENSGFSLEHTFEVPGEYEIYCLPHRAQGMEATIVVDEEAELPGGDDGGGGGGGPTIPDSAKTIGVASFVAMVSTLGLAFFFMKYGGDYRTPE